MKTLIFYTMALVVIIAYIVYNDILSDIRFNECLGDSGEVTQEWIDKCKRDSHARIR